METYRKRHTCRLETEPEDMARSSAFIYGEEGDRTVTEAA
jgi:hypothetical protein